MGGRYGDNLSRLQGGAIPLLGGYDSLLHTVASLRTDPCPVPPTYRRDACVKDV